VVDTEPARPAGPGGPAGSVQPCSMPHRSRCFSSGDDMWMTGPVYETIEEGGAQCPRCQVWTRKRRAGHIRPLWRRDIGPGSGGHAAVLDGQQPRRSHDWAETKNKGILIEVRELVHNNTKTPREEFRTNHFGPTVIDWLLQPSGRRLSSRRSSSSSESLRSDRSNRRGPARTN
jgi:hypothetical protein